MSKDQTNNVKIKKYPQNKKHKYKEHKNKQIKNYSPPQNKTKQNTDLGYSGDIDHHRKLIPILHNVRLSRNSRCISVRFSRIWMMYKFLLPSNLHKTIVRLSPFQPKQSASCRLWNAGSFLPVRTYSPSSLHHLVLNTLNLLNSWNLFDSLHYLTGCSSSLNCCVSPNIYLYMHI